MSSKKTLNAKNLEALGAERLAELLIEISTGDAAAKRRLRLELAGVQGTQDVAKEVRKRIASIGRSRSYVDWTKRRALIDDLETQRKAIAEKIAPDDPQEALDLSWRFMALAESVHHRTDDGSGAVGAVFYSACIDLAEIALAAKPDPVRLAEQAFAALMDNGFGEYDPLLPRLGPALGPEGFRRIKELAQPLIDAPPPEPKSDRKVIAYGSMGPVYDDEFYHGVRQRTARRILQEVADTEGDVDAYVALIEDATRRVPKVAAQIAARLLDAGRAADALAALDAADDLRRGLPQFDWEDARIRTLEALGRPQDAQDVRWLMFERLLSPSHLKDYLKRHPEFDDVEEEERALYLVEQHRDRMSALGFLVDWPALDRAARLVVAHPEALDGDLYQILTPAAEALAAKHPLAATLALRAMIEFSLKESRTSRYRHAARHLMECASLAATIGDGYGTFESHDAFGARLRKEHGRKTSFWSNVPL